jgi:peptidyl-prolyl cis-trans isomerase SurA
MKRVLTLFLCLFAFLSYGQEQNLKNELALKKSLMIRDMIQNGSDFGEMARRFSEDPGSAKNGGEIGYMMPGSLVDEYWNAAYELKIGELSEPVKSKYGFHIIEVLGKKGGAINTRHILIIPK